MADKDRFNTLPVTDRQQRVSALQRMRCATFKAKALLKEVTMKMQFFAVASLVMASLASFPAHAQAERERHSIKQTTPNTGTNIPRDEVISELPFDKTYSQLTPDQQWRVKAQYERMEASDEPPFPIDGLGPLYKAISKGQQILHASGVLDIHVQINSKGEATSVSMVKSPSDEMTRYVAHVAMLTKYKPAVCSGQPCAMPFPIRINLQRRP